jgi:exodeoxyribonuclease VII small subunit
MAAKKTPADAPIDFEAAMKRLETIVEELESGELTLEDSIARYEEGVKLSRGLTGKLDEAEKRIERLVENDGDEAPGTAPVELESDDRGPELPF